MPFLASPNSMSSSEVREIPLEVVVQQKLGDDTSWLEYVGPFTIFRVPADIRMSKRSLYEPRVVSIGPYYYHLRKDRLREMEDQKWRLLRSFMYRNSELNVSTYLKVVGSFEKEARESYTEPINLSSDNFIQMLLLDGCFILELFLKWRNEEPDVLFEGGWGSNRIFSDLLLFENQIPFVIIERLYETIMTGRADSNRDNFLILFAKFLMDEEEPHTSTVTWPEKIHHLLDLFHHFLISGLFQNETNHDVAAIPIWKQWLNHLSTQNPDQRSAKFPPHQIPCATELYEVGVKFKKRRFPKNLFDVKFKRGTLEIPPLQINSDKKRLLTSLVALEKHKTWGDQTVTSYMALMDSLINTKKDVELLQRAGVIHNLLSSHHEAACFFNELGDSTSFDSMNRRFMEVMKNVQLYCNSSWNWSWARLFHDHCNSPWTAIGVIAGMFLLGLTTLQTFYTVYPYYQPRH